MIKRNKLSIFLLAVVVMLTIYYIKTPTNSGSDKLNNQTPVASVERYPLYAESRLIILDARGTKISELEGVLASSKSTMSEKEVALETISQLNELTEKEIVLETAIITLGYEDCFVNAVDNSVRVQVLSSEFSAEKFVEIALIAKEKFGNDCVVSVKVNETKKLKTFMRENPHLSFFLK